MEKKKYLFYNAGCDDITMTELELTDKELEFLKNVARANNRNSSCACQPRISIYEKYEIEDDEYGFDVNEIDFNSDVVGGKNG